MLRTGRARYQHLRGPLRLSSTTRSVLSFSHLSPVTSSNQFVAAQIVQMANSACLPSITQQSFFVTKSSSLFQRHNNTEERKQSTQKKIHSQLKRYSTRSNTRPSKPDSVQIPASGVKSDLKTVKETLSLSSVPKEPYLLGLAGTLPYLGTSVSTVYLAWVINTARPSSSTFANDLMINKDVASHILAMIEPIQLGYGAVIISFLGAIHWGLEYAEKNSDQSRTRFRYGIGVMSSIVAWPTLFMPIEFALITQFAAFVTLYFADARATVRGWAPSWYGIYRFALTAVVGVAIVISLIGRAKVGDASPRLTGLSGKIHEHHSEEEYTKQWQDLEQKERVKLKKQAKEEARRKKEQYQKQEEK
ncbi:hypothetical protein GGS21DRAFT_534737 [Xylaria nigripes]|nr:hypothetical protein GGS21DRAFT_534737 [Xylaria nigripes]